MDIKSKSRHSLGILLIMAAIILPSVMMTALYPYFKTQVSETTNEDSDISLLAERLVNGSFVLYVESEEIKNQGRVSPTDLFLTEKYSFSESNGVVTDTYGMDSIEAGNEEAFGMDGYHDAYQNNRYFEEELLNRYRYWRESFESLRQKSQYQVMDGEQIIAANTDRELSEYMQAVFEYDNLGNLHVSKSGSGWSELEKGLDFTVAAESINRNFNNQFSQLYGYENSLAFQPPVNFKVVFAISKEGLNSFFDGMSYREVWPYYNSGIVMYAFVAFITLVALAALLLPCIKTLGIGKEKVFQMPVELVLFVGIPCTFALGHNMIELVAETNTGLLQHELLKANFLPETVSDLTMIINIAAWCFVFAFGYWSVANLRGIFEIGLVRYWRERTWIYSIYSWLKRGFTAGFHKLEQIDLRDKSNKTILKIVGANFLVLAIFCSLWVFGIGILLLYSIVLFFLLRNYYDRIAEKYQILLEATNQIAEGNLDVEITEDIGIFEPMKEELQKIQAGFKKAVEEEVKSQKMKTDLITNVSHDLKTPLTAIITYVGLLKEDDITKEERESYISVLEQKSMRLKTLIEDLFEVSKATSNNVTLNLMEVDIIRLLKQTGMELSDKIEESGLDFRWRLPKQKVILDLDSQKTYRIFENLLINIVKYAMPGTRVYIEAEAENSQVVITMKNISASELDFNPNEITERFVRGDKSRNTDGSGLGLAIAKSFVEIQNGNMDVSVDGDLFRVRITWTYKEVRDLEEQSKDLDSLTAEGGEL